jgi:hypothetical protein
LISNSYKRLNSIQLLLMATVVLSFFVSSVAVGALPLAVSLTRWGVVQLVGHLTVNEDGEGSNPSAPANLQFLLFVQSD